MTLSIILCRPRPPARGGLVDHALAAGGGAARSAPVRRRLVRRAAERSDLITDRVAAQMCRVSLRVIGLWVETGAWPLPETVHATTMYFRAPDVACWLDSGAWPISVQFLGLPDQVGDGGTPMRHGRRGSPTVGTIARKVERPANPVGC